MSGFLAWLAVTDGTIGSNFCLSRVEEMTFWGLVRRQYLNPIVWLARGIS
jgi:hypothetical protein